MNCLTLIHSDEARALSVCGIYFGDGGAVQTKVVFPKGTLDLESH